MKIAHKIINGVFLTIACITTLVPLFFLRLDQYPEKAIVVIIPSYKNQQWVEKNLASVFTQKYKNYRVVYVDDNSPDNTYALAQEVTARFNQTHRTTIIHNEARKGAMANWYNTIHSCKDKEIVVQLDGDDWLAHPYVLAYINSIYANKNIWITYGQFLEYPSARLGILYNLPFPHKVVQNNTQRAYKNLPMAHLRTFYAWLFKQIKLEDLMYEGNFYPMACDKAQLAPMIEMAGEHYACISEVLYIYNNSNPINVHRINMPLQHAIAEHIAQQKHCQPLTIAQYNNLMQNAS